MVYPEYQVAYKRHLNTCKQLKNLLIILQQKEEEGTIKKEEKKLKPQLLANLYYLTGYIIECGYNHAIYESIGYSKTLPVHRLEARNRQINNATQFISLQFQKSNDSNIFSIMRDDHKLYNNMNFFSLQAFNHLQELNNELSKLFDNDNPNENNIHQRPCEELFKKWGAKMRYETKIIPELEDYQNDNVPELNYENVFDFLKLASDFSNILKTHRLLS